MGTVVSMDRRAPLRRQVVRVLGLMALAVLFTALVSVLLERAGLPNWPVLSVSVVVIPAWGVKLLLDRLS